jgi:hypothetical protein
MYLTNKSITISLMLLLTVITVVSVDSILSDVHASTSRADGFATDGTDINKWENSCYNGGVKDGKNGPFEGEAYQECGDYGDGADRYYEGFIEGCEDVGNTKDVCESATDK